jgi:hypothetical protein
MAADAEEREGTCCLFVPVKIRGIAGRVLGYIRVKNASRDRNLVATGKWCSDAYQALDWILNDLPYMSAVTFSSCRDR